MITFIIPTLPDEPYLARTLESIVGDIERSKHQGFEVFVIGNDNEEKRLSKIAGEFRRSYEYVRFFDVPGNRSEARNYGIRKASNEFLTFVDADTMIGRGFTEVTIEDFVKGYGYINYSTMPLENKMMYHFSAKFLNFSSRFLTELGICRPAGFCTSMRRNILEEIKLGDDYFLPKLAGHGEDSELGSRYGRYCRKNKIKGKYENRVNVYTSMRELEKVGVKRAFARLLVNNTLGAVLKRPLVRNWREY